MLGLSKFDQMMSRNGDGLLPEMRALFDRLAAIKASDNVTELAHYRDRLTSQSGPNLSTGHHGTAANVVPLRSARTAQRNS